MKYMWWETKSLYKEKKVTGINSGVAKPDLKTSYFNKCESLDIGVKNIY